MQYRYTWENTNTYATLSGTVITDAPGFIVQLLDANYQMVAEIRNEQHYQFKEILPGSYRLRLLVLQDKEGAWSCGNIYERKEPDPVLVYPKEVNIPPGWEITGIDFSTP